MNKLMIQALTAATAGVVGAVVLTTMPVPAFAASAAATSPQAKYARDTARCRTITTHTERANCLSEASTAFAQTQPSKPEENPSQLMANALRRCATLPQPDKRDCEARIQGQGTTSGSVAAGGILRELVTREVVLDPAALPPTAAGVPAAPAPMPAPAAMPAPQPVSPAAPTTPAYPAMPIPPMTPASAP